jgi:hypothetical protein
VTIASSGYLHDIYADVVETVPDLYWPNSVTVYSQMRTDPQLQGILSAFTLPLRRATWAVDPAGCRPEVVTLVADDLGLPILGQEASPSGARRRGVRWSDHLRLAMLQLVFGHMPFEQRYDTSGPQTRLVELSERMPSTIAQIATNTDGSLKGITQYNAINNQLITANRLVWYVHEREGSAWQGRSVLRPAYAPWLLKREMQRVLATSSRRFGAGTPVVEAPPGATPGQVLEAQRLASSIRVGDQGGMGLPNGFRATLTGITGSVPDTLAFIRYLDQQMSTMALAGMLDLGSTPNGSRALGNAFIDLFMLALQSIGTGIADTASADISVDLVDLNWGEDEPVPRIVCTEVGASDEVTAEALASLLNSGALSADPALEAYVREKWKLPVREVQDGKPAPSSPIFQYDLDAGTATINERRTQLGLPPVEGGDVSAAQYAIAIGLPTQPVAASMAATPSSIAAAARKREVHAAPATQFHRQPTVLETAAKTDFAAVQGDWQSALDKLANDWTSITADQRQQLLDQIQAAVDAGDLEALGTLTVDSQAAADLLAERMHEIADAAAQQQADEAKAQGAAIAPGTPDTDRLDALAVTFAALAATGLASYAARQAVQVWAPDTTAATVLDFVGSQIDTLTDSSLRDVLGGGLSAAQNDGRLTTLDAAAADGTPAAVYAASEIMDSATCANCSGIDGHEYDNLDEAKADYANGGYNQCLGGLRCRGIIVAVWSDASDYGLAASVGR